MEKMTSSPPARKATKRTVVSADFVGRPPGSGGGASTRAGAGRNSGGTTTSELQ
jgi:hypothetical protein